MTNKAEDTFEKLAVQVSQIKKPILVQFNSSGVSNWHHASIKISHDSHQSTVKRSLDSTNLEKSSPRRAAHVAWRVTSYDQFCYR